MWASASTSSTEQDLVQRAHALVNDPDFISFVYIDSRTSSKQYTMEDFEMVCRVRQEALLTNPLDFGLAHLFVWKQGMIGGSIDSGDNWLNLNGGKNCHVLDEIVDRLVDLMREQGPDPDRDHMSLQMFPRVPPGNLRTKMLQIGLASGQFTVDTVLSSITGCNCFFRKQLMADIDTVFAHFEQQGEQATRLQDPIIARYWHQREHSPLFYLTPSRQSALFSSHAPLVDKKELLGYLERSFRQPWFCRSPGHALGALHDGLLFYGVSGEDYFDSVGKVLAKNLDILLQTDNPELFDSMLTENIVVEAVDGFMEMLPGRSVRKHLFGPKAQSNVCELISRLKSPVHRAYLELALMPSNQPDHSLPFTTVESIASLQQNIELRKFVPCELFLSVFGDFPCCLASMFRTCHATSSPRNPIKFLKTLIAGKHENISQLKRFFSGKHAPMGPDRVARIKRLIASIEEYNVEDVKNSLVTTVLGRIARLRPQAFLQDDDMQGSRCYTFADSKQEALLHSLVFRVGPFALLNNSESESQVLDLFEDLATVLFPKRMLQLKAVRQVIGLDADIVVLCQQPWIRKDWLVTYYGNLHSSDPKFKFIPRIFGDEHAKTAFLAFVEISLKAYEKSRKDDLDT